MLRNTSTLAAALFVSLGLIACSGGSPSGTQPLNPADSGKPLVDAGAVATKDSSAAETSNGVDAGTEAATEAGAPAPDAGSDASSGIHLSGTPKIMTFGDSITAATCWRARFWEDLEKNGYKNFQMVGSQDSSGNCSDPNYDGHNEGHSGYLVVNLANEEPNGEMDGWFSANPPDVVLMHIGTNDVWNKLPTTTILDAYGVAIDTLRKYAPNVVILLAQIIPMNPSGCSVCAAGVQALDAAIPAWAATKSTKASPIVVVDQWTGFNDANDTYDGVHPNDSTGSQKIADKWYSVLAPML